MCVCVCSTLRSPTLASKAARSKERSFLVHLVCSCMQLHGTEMNKDTKYYHQETPLRGLDASLYMGLKSRGVQRCKFLMKRVFYFRNITSGDIERKYLETLDPHQHG